MAIKYLAGERLIGTAAERTALTLGVSTAGCLGLWKFQDQALTGQVTQDTGGANQTVMTNGNEAHYGIYLGSGSALIGTTISNIAFHLKMGADPSTENKVYCRLWRDGAFIHTFGEADPDDINVSSYEWHTFGTGGDDDAGNGTSVALEEDDAILLSWDRVSGNSFWLGIEYSSSNQYDGTNTGTCVSNTSGTPSSVSFTNSRDVVFRINHATSLTNDATTANGFANGLGSAANGAVDSTIVKNSAGKFRTYAYTFDDSVMEKVTVPDQNGLDITGDITMPAWLYPTEDGDGGRNFFTKRTGSAANYQFYGRTPGGSYLYLAFYDGSSSFTTTTTDISRNAWHFVVMTISSNVIKMYVDNVEQSLSATSISTRTANAAPLMFGMHSGATSEDYAGRMQDCSIWNRSLSASELTTLWTTSAGVAGGGYKIEDGLVYPTFSNGTIYEESDTGKHYMFDGTSAWNEM